MVAMLSIASALEAGLLGDLLASVFLYVDRLERRAGITDRDCGSAWALSRNL